MGTSELFEYLPKIGTVDTPHLGRIVAVAPLGQDTEFYLTLPKGKGTNMWYGMMSYLGNKGFEVVKVEEMLDVSAVDQGYYALTQRNKEELEGKIKQGLASVSQSVADYELIAHDWRVYEGFLKMLKTGDEHSLRATFIDDVDISTGNNAIKTAIARWPTMIADFMRLGEIDGGKFKDEVDVGKISEKLGVSKAEAVILSTKQRFYKDWKQRFGKEVENRCQRILALKNSREMTINEYREWLRPIVARHKMYQEGLAGKTPSDAAFSAFSSPAQAMSTNAIEVWAWQPMLGIVGRTGTMQTGSEDDIKPYDNFVRQHFILSKEQEDEDKKYDMLTKMHTWITEDWVKEKAKEVVDKGWIKKDELYYAFLRLRYERAVLRSPDGTEMEDLTFKPKMYFYSMNALFVMLLHFMALQKEFDDYINQLIGFTSQTGQEPKKQLDDIINEWKGEEKKEGGNKKTFDLDPLKKDVKETWKKVDKVFGFKFSLFRSGPYEHNFMDRIATPYLATEGADFWSLITKYLHEGAGIGK